MYTQHTATPKSFTGTRRTNRISTGNNRMPVCCLHCRCLSSSRRKGLCSFSEQGTAQGQQRPAREKHDKMSLQQLSAISRIETVYVEMRAQQTRVEIKFK